MSDTGQQHSLVVRCLCILHVLYFKSASAQSRVHSGAVGWGTALQAIRSWFWFPGGSLGFFIDFSATLWSWGWLILQQKWISGLCPRGKDGWQPCHVRVPFVYYKFWQPQPLGAARACPGLYRVCFTSSTKIRVNSIHFLNVIYKFKVCNFHTCCYRTF